MRARKLPRLMLVTDRRRCRGRPLPEVVAAAAAGGVELVQLREKDLSEEEFDSLARRLREALPEDVEILVNGRPAIARRYGWGLHLPEGAPLPDGFSGSGGASRVRWGRSVHDASAAGQAREQEADYVVVGTIFASESKPGLAPAGVDRIREILPHVGRVPIFAIGGITAARVPCLLESGAWGVAVCGAISDAEEPRRAAAEIVRAVHVSSPRRARY